MRAQLAVTGATDPAGAPLPLDPAIAARVHASVLAILDENVLGAFATVTPDGRAHVHTAYFCVASDLALYFLSNPASAHSRNLSANASGAAAIYASTQTWGGPDRGVQLFGACAVATGARAAEAERLYRRRFPDYARWSSRLAPRDAARTHRFYRLSTKTLQILDEEALGDGVLVRATLRRGRRRRPTAAAPAAPRASGRAPRRRTASRRARARGTSAVRARRTAGARGSSGPRGAAP
jgi:uncharacterized protein YhbP (UPF0306 family)